MLTKVEKDTIILQIRKQIESAQAIFLTNLIGVSSNDSVELRKQMRKAKGNVIIARNSLFARASAGTYAENLCSNLKGPSALVFACEDAPPVAKILKAASEEFDVVKIRGGHLKEEPLDIATILELADLPSRDDMLATTLATMMAPVSTFVRLLQTIKDTCEERGLTCPKELVNNEQ